MINTLKTIVSVVTVITSVVIAVAELKKAIDQFRKNKEESPSGGRPAIIQID